MEYFYNVNKLTEECTDWIKQWFANNGDDQTKAVIGISGGKDSTVCANILVRALGAERVIGVIIPNGEQSDIKDAQEAADLAGIKTYTVNIKNAYDALSNEIVSSGLAKDIESLSESYITNTPSRLRMATLYGIAAIIGNCRVVNTGNRSEEVVGYSTIFGDGAGDFAPFKNLTTDEIMAIGDYVGLPDNLVHKVPNDGMSKTTKGNLISDEDKLGMKYADINKAIRTADSLDEVKSNTKLMVAYEKNKFKLNLLNIPSFIPNLPDIFKEKSDEAKTE